MNNIIKITFFVLISLFGYSQNKVCENITFNSFEIDTKQENTLAINVKVENENSLMPINYPGFLLLNEMGDTVAHTTKEYATYTLADNKIYKLKIVKELAIDFSGDIEIYSGYLGHQLKNKQCSKSVQFNLSGKALKFIIDDKSDPSVDNAIYIEHMGNETIGAGRIKKVNKREWYEYGEENSAIINVFQETHRDKNYIYLISRDAIFQFDLTRNKIMKNGVDIFELSKYSNKHIEIESSLPECFEGEK